MVSYTQDTRYSPLNQEDDTFVGQQTVARSDTYAADTGNNILQEPLDNGDGQNQGNIQTCSHAVDDSEPQFTIRAVIVGLLFGTVLCFSNTYFGLQTGWISMMSLQASLVGFAVFKAVEKFLDRPLSPAENVVLQTTSVATATMPLAAGFVGVIPALAMLTPEESRGYLTNPSYIQLSLWALGVAFFGVFFAVPLRKQTIIREKLRFPSGTATAQMISVLHRLPDPTIEEEQSERGIQNSQGQQHGLRRRIPHSHIKSTVSASGAEDGIQGVEPREYQDRTNLTGGIAASSPSPTGSSIRKPSSLDELNQLDPEDRNALSSGNFDADWKNKLQSLIVSFLISGVYTLLAFIFPILSKVPIFGNPASKDWLWNFTPSLSYAGQGIIMGLPTCVWMLVGAVVGWGILSPVAKYSGWAPGPVDDWKEGSRGWILWVSLAVMIADSLVSLAVISYKEIRYRLIMVKKSSLWSKLNPKKNKNAGLQESDGLSPAPGHQAQSPQEYEEQPLSPEYRDEISFDAPDVDSKYLVPAWLTWTGLAASSLFCAGIMYYLFHVPFQASILSVIIACLMAILGVRALGETDLNPVSGIAKVSQFIFAGVLPGNLVGNIVSGAVAEAGAQQAGDLMQDLKTGHLLHASPRAQFYAQLIGSLFSAFIAAGIYKLYTTVYEIPGPQFPAPTAQVWLDMARLVNGHPLPTNVVPFAISFAALFAVLSVLKSVVISRLSKNPQNEDRKAFVNRWWPSGIAFAIGIYNTPNFTLMRVLGALLATLWIKMKAKRMLRKQQKSGSEHSTIVELRSRATVMVIIVASGFVLGEGTFSFFTLIAKAVKH
ncbi:OPT super [Mycoemilia scoparia]|uniref:OPT super n=1 Tax=Mycoemilia scoparia TaxID=417184 RepID=A0A9W7ZYL4_9FUNG|nr:OPT super [Mycoemilia scoparia]